MLYAICCTLYAVRCTLLKTVVAAAVIVGLVFSPAVVRASKVARASSPCNHGQDGRATEDGCATQATSFIVLGDLHYDKLEFHDLDWVKNKWVNPDDHRQITQEYTVFTAQNWDKLMKAVGRRIGEGGGRFDRLTVLSEVEGKVKGIVQLGDLMEGIAGSPELAKKMNNGAVQALKEPNFPVPWILVKGNHDGHYGPGEAEAYNEIMVPFRNSQIGITTPGISFRYRVGDVEFFCPDSEMKLDELIAFLEKGLAESTAKFKFVAMHIPMIPVTGRCWDVFKFKDMKTRAENQERLLGLIAKNKAIVLCAHLHRYSVVRRETKQGPVVQVMVNSVIRDGNSPPPYWYSKEFGPALVDMEPNFAPATAEQRREVLRQEAKYVTDFRIADLPGHAVLAIKGDKVSLKMYRGVSDTVQEEVDLTEMLQEATLVAGRSSLESRLTSDEIRATRYERRDTTNDPNAAKIDPSTGSGSTLSVVECVDLSKDKVLYVVGYAHLDTEWRWDYTTTIDDFIKSTLDDNFTLFEKYPAYTFNFTGSTRYAMMKEYYPSKYQKLKDYIAQGRWFVSGSSVDEGDTLIPSAESVIRQILYGNDYFRKEFGKESNDYMLPDCFGFPASLPTVLSHCGVKGFSTQKLTWRSAVGIPFNVGVWEGPDGKSVIAALNPTVYLSRIPDRLDINDVWVKRVEENGAKYGVFADYRYYGVGDMGGAPREQDVANAVKSLNNPDGKIKVVLASSQQMYNDITEEQKAKLPRYKGDFLLTLHSAGVLTSQAYMKRWNCKNELLADSAERAAAAAQWLGGATYPQEKLNWSWIRVLSSQFHDILPGTSIPKAYEYAWNDEIVAMNGFAAVLTDSAGAVSRGLDTQVKGKAIVVYNPLAIEREDVVEAQVDFGGKIPAAVQVFGPDGKEVPSQIAAAADNSVKVLFLAKMLSVGFAVYDVRPAKAACTIATGLTVTKRTVENEFYKVTINDRGDVASIVDKKNGKKELLAGPIRLEFMKERPQRAPAWDMDWDDQSKPPYAYLDGPAKIKIVEKGPVRAAIEIKRHAQNSEFIQKVKLSAGQAGRRIEFGDAIDWLSAGCALKAAFPLSVANSKATYNWGVGTVERSNNDPNKYEVPSHEWFDLTDRNGKYGVTVLQHCKFGSDKPNDNTLRLTLLYTPGVRDSFMDQGSQDWGRHDIVYGLYGHEGDWRQGQCEWQARRLNQPLAAFEVAAHDGKLGKVFSLLSVSTPAVDSTSSPQVDSTSSPQVDVRAIKKAEHCDYMIVRVQELFGQEAKNVTISLAGKIAAAYEVDGQERQIGSARVENGKLVCDMTKYGLRSFAVKMEKSNVAIAPPTSEIVALDYNTDVISTDDDCRDGNIGSGYTIPAEMLPGEIVSEGIHFRMGGGADGRNNAVECNGQTVALPKGRYNRLYILAAAVEETGGVFRFGERGVRLTVQPWTGFVGQYDNRIWDRQLTKMEFKCDANVVGIKTGFIKRDTIAWFCTHRHQHTSGNEAYQFSYIFKYGMDIPEGAVSVTLPDNNKIKIFAMTASNNENDTVRAVTPLYDGSTCSPRDDFTGREPVVFSR